MARRQAELDAVVGQYRVDFVRDGFDEPDEEGRSGDAIGFLDQLNEGELRRAVDGDEEVELWECQIFCVWGRLTIML